MNCGAYIVNVKQKHAGCKKSARPIRSSPTHATKWLPCFTQVLHGHSYRRQKVAIDKGSFRSA